MPVEPFWLSESAHYLCSVLSVPTIDTVYLFSLYSIYIETSVPIHPKSYTLPPPPPPFPRIPYVVGAYCICSQFGSFPTFPMTCGHSIHRQTIRSTM